MKSLLKKRSLSRAGLASARALQKSSWACEMVRPVTAQPYRSASGMAGLPSRNPGRELILARKSDPFGNDPYLIVLGLLQRHVHSIEERARIGKRRPQDVRHEHGVGIVVLDHRPGRADREEPLLEYVSDCVKSVRQHEPFLKL